MVYYIYVVTKSLNKYKIREIPITPEVDEVVVKARQVSNYVSHFITTTPPDKIIEEMATYFEGLTFL